MKDLSSTTRICAANAVAGKASTSDLAIGKPCYFALFRLNPSFCIDLEALAEQYRRLSAEVHPDHFADAGEHERMVALGRAADLNEAYQTLKNATSRAIYLLRLRGCPVDQERTVQDPEFLEQQMQWYETLEVLESQADMDGVLGFRKRLQQAKADLEAQFDRHMQQTLDGAGLGLAERLVRRMQFLDKLHYETRRLEERLDD